MGKLFKNLFLYLTIALLIIILIRTILGLTDPFNLDSLLTIIQNSPKIDLSSPNITINGDWGIFDFLRILINTIQQVLDFIVNLVELIINFFSFIAYYLYSFFGINLGLS